jgi:hypothetical protein
MSVVGWHAGRAPKAPRIELVLTYILTLHTEEERAKWNKLVHFMLDDPEHWWGYNGRAGKISNGGLAYATVESWRLNPEVAIVTRGEEEYTIDDLHDMIGQPDPYKTLYRVLVAFVPYSVVHSEDPAQPTKLILPMGLQKTPGGFGFTEAPPDPEDTVVLEDGQRVFPRQPGAVGGVIQRFASAIHRRHKCITLLTRFAFDAGLYKKVWDSRGLAQWSRAFPERLCVGWKEYNRMYDDRPNIVQRNKRIIDRETPMLERLQHKEDTVGLRASEASKLQKRKDTIAKAEQEIANLSKPIWVEEQLSDAQKHNELIMFGTPFKEYYPRGGGASISGGQFQVTDEYGHCIFYRTDYEDIQPIKRLLGPEVHKMLGVLMCAWTEPPPDATTTHICALDTPEKIKTWNAIVEFMRCDPKNWHGKKGAYVRGISTGGLNYADVETWRVNPEVAIITRGSKPFTLEELRALLWQDNPYQKLMRVLVAYVPYSVVPSDEPGKYNTKLILPMGLQKTPGGFGYTEKPPNMDQVVLHKGERVHPQQPNAVKNVIQKLTGAIQEHHGRASILTRFAHEIGPVWKSGGIRQWCTAFPNHLRVGWKSYYFEHDHRGDELKHLQFDIKQEQAEIERLKQKQQQHGKLGIADLEKLKGSQKNVEHFKKMIRELPEKILTVETDAEEHDKDNPLMRGDKFAGYNPGEGGASVHNNTLTITDRDNQIIFYKNKCNTIAPIERLLGPRWTEALGVVICTWPD